MNQAEIIFENDKGNQKVLMCRSGRTDSKEKIRDKSLGDITARLNAANVNSKDDPCLKKVGDHYEYRRVDNTLMDSSILKSAFTQGKSLFKNVGAEKPIESERMFVENKKKAIKKTWNPKNENVHFDKEKKLHYIEHNLEQGGQTHKIREYEPLVNEYVFSAQSNSKTNLEAARNANRPAILEMGRVFSEKYLGDIEGLQEKFQACCDHPKSTSRLIDLQNTIKELKNVDDEIRIALDGIYACLAGVDRQTGQSVDTVEGAAIQYLYASHIADLSGLAYAKVAMIAQRRRWH